MRYFQPFDHRVCSIKLRELLNYCLLFATNALYDVWYHRIQKHPFSSVHLEKTISRRFLINNFNLGTVLENLRFWVPEKNRILVDWKLKRRKKSPFSKISGYVWTAPVKYSYRGSHSVGIGHERRTDETDDFGGIWFAKTQDKHWRVELVKPPWAGGHTFIGPKRNRMWFSWGRRAGGSMKS